MDMKSPNISIVGDEVQEDEKQKVIEESRGENLWIEIKPLGKNIQRRGNHSAAIYKDQFFIIYYSRMYIYGGYEATSGILSDFQTISLVEQSEWIELTPVNQDPTSYPGPLRNHSTVVHQNQMFIFGGVQKSLQGSSQLWAYNFETQIWAVISRATHKNAEITIEGHASLLWESDKIVSYCGFYSGALGGYSSRVLSYDIQDQSWSFLFDHKDEYGDGEGVRYPFKRAGSGITIANDYLYMFGGTNVQKRYGDFWRFQLRECVWEQIIVEGFNPDSRSSPTLTLHPSQNILLLFGGIHDITHEKNDVCVYKIQDQKWLIFDQDSRNNKQTQQQYLSPQISPKMSPKQFANFNQQTNKHQSGQFFIKSGSPIPGSKSPQKMVKGFKPYRVLNNSIIPSQSLVTEEPIAYVNNIEEQKKRRQQIKKSNLLSQFEMNDMEKKNFRCSSPTMDQMKNSISSVVNENEAPKSHHKTPQRIIVDVIQNQIGTKPCARDGHTAVIFKDQMIIFGGDRHLMSFADTFSLQLNKIKI